MTELDRRSFLVIGSGALAVGSLPAGAVNLRAAQRPMVISSGNGVPAVERALQQLNTGASPTDAVVAGVTIVEDDPEDMSVGLGGLPNEEGVVQLDASVMDGRMHKAGAVAALENIRNAAQVALKVLRTTDHVLIVGDGARRFALRHGFTEENLLTDKARQAWLKWKAGLNPDDDWLDADQQINGSPRKDAAAAAIPHTWGTIHCAAVDANGDIGACTTTSGLSYKIPGRVGDSPIIGAGMYVDNTIGAAGATGRGEAVIQSCGSFQTVMHMAAGLEPEAACLKTLKAIADHTHRGDLLNARGEPNFQVTMYALRKDGAFGSASMHKGAAFSFSDGNAARKQEAAYLFE